MSVVTLTPQTFTYLNQAIADAGVGGEVVLSAGVYNRPTKTVDITNGGVTVRAEAGAVIQGSRDYPLRDGYPLFRLLNGANDLTFANIEARGFGNGVWLVPSSSTIEELIIRDALLSNVMRGVEIVGTASGLTVEDTFVQEFSKGAVRVAGDSHDITIRNVFGDSNFIDGDNFSMGVVLQGTVHDVLIDNVTMKNSRDTLHDYWNGDGFMFETGVRNVLMRDAVAEDCTDAGYDIKCDVQMDRCIARRNKRNFRLRARSYLRWCEGWNPFSRGGVGPAAQLDVPWDTADISLMACRWEPLMPFMASGGEIYEFDTIPQ